MKEKIKKCGIQYIVATIFISIIAICAVALLINDIKKNKIQGEIEVEQYQVRCNSSGKVLDVCVKEGDFVNVGDTLAIFSGMLPLPENQNELIEYHRRQITKEKKTIEARQEYLNIAYNMWQQAMAGADVALNNYNKIERLFNEGMIDEHERSQAYITFKAMEAQERAAKRQYEMLRNNMQREEQRVDNKHIAARKSKTDDTDMYMQEYVLTSQTAGEINKIFIAEGDLVEKNLPLMTVSVLADVYTTFSVEEDMLGEMKVGDTFVAFCPAFNKDIELKIYYLKDKEMSNMSQTKNGTTERNLKTFEVRARVLTPFDGLRPGMSLIAKKK